jgi:hypothetical protein
MYRKSCDYRGRTLRKAVECTTSYIAPNDVLNGADGDAAYRMFGNFGVHECRPEIFRDAILFLDLIYFLLRL